MLRRMRLISQVMFFILFCATVFFLMDTALAYSWPAMWFLRLNPLNAVLPIIASRDIIIPLAAMGLAVLVLTVLFGRFFCGFLCPLGALIDFTDKFLFKHLRARLRSPHVSLQRLKYVLLIILCILAIFGSLAPLFMDPVLMLTRMFALVLAPMANTAARFFQAGIAPISPALGIESLAYVTIKPILFYGIAGALAFIGCALIGGIMRPRFWCQYICPTGAFLGFFSRFAVFRRLVDVPSCSSCGACIKVCPVSAISPDYKTTSTAECIVCGKCTQRKNTCNHFGFARFSSKQTAGVDIRRRHALAGITAGLLCVPIFRSNASSVRDASGKTIRPPGAIPERKFLAQCISCGACMKVCPTNCLQPCLFEEGFHRMYTPRLAARIAGCEEKCTACGNVCPTQAIRKLPYEEKRFAKIGTAVIDRHRCLAWEQNKECVVCDEVCPYNAITVRVEQTTTGPYKVPIINEDLCLGCGMCEQHCPISDKAAIEVFRFGENRREHGPYATAEEKEKILKKRLVSDENSGAGMKKEATAGYGDLPAAPQAPATDTSAVSSRPAQTDLPPGFVF